MKVIYSPRFDINFFGLEKLHPFDARKYSRAWARVPQLHENALTEGLVFNLSGGYHHAKPDQGEGFCPFNDIAVAIAILRAEGLLGNIIYVDMDAHMGNGVAHCFLDDRYPYSDTLARQRLDWPIPLKDGTAGPLYLSLLKAQLPEFIETVASMGEIALAIYNAGTDPFEKDLLGGLRLTEPEILERDLFVLTTLRALNLPTLILPSGGYSDASHRLIANMLQGALGLPEELSC